MQAKFTHIPRTDNVLTYVKGRLAERLQCTVYLDDLRADLVAAATHTEAVGGGIPGHHAIGYCGL